MSKKDPLFDQFDELTDAAEAYQKKIKKDGERIVKSVLKELFKKHDNLKSIKWSQYTPYFNDGEECVFGVHGVEVEVVEDGQPVIDEDEGTGVWLSTYSDKFPKNLRKDVLALEEKFEEIDETLKFVFGDHAEITVTPTDITVEECEHE